MITWCCQCLCLIHIYVLSLEFWLLFVYFQSVDFDTFWFTFSDYGIQNVSFKNECLHGGELRECLILVLIIKCKIRLRSWLKNVAITLKLTNWAFHKLVCNMQSLAIQWGDTMFNFIVKKGSYKSWCYLIMFPYKVFDGWMF